MTNRLARKSSRIGWDTLPSDTSTMMLTVCGTTTTSTVMATSIWRSIRTSHLVSSRVSPWLLSARVATISVWMLLWNWLLASVGICGWLWWPIVRVLWFPRDALLIHCLLSSHQIWIWSMTTTATRLTDRGSRETPRGLEWPIKMEIKNWTEMTLQIFCTQVSIKLPSNLQTYWIII